LSDVQQSQELSQVRWGRCLTVLVKFNRSAGSELLRIARAIADLQNKEVEFSWRTALDILISVYPDYWLIQILRE